MVTRKVLMTLGLLATAAVVNAVSVPLNPVVPAAVASTSSVPVDISAGSMEYIKAREVIVASGNVVIRSGEEELRADSVTLNVKTQEAQASGNVVFTRGRTVWKGNALNYNFSTGAWKTGEFDSYYDPFFVTAKSSYRTNETEYVLNGAVITTCTNAAPHRHYTLSCRRIRLVPGEKLTGSGAVVRMGRVPVFYLPWVYRSLSDRSVGFSAEAGYRNRMGAFLLTSTKYWMSPVFRGITQVDYRSERGPAAGQEVGWLLDRDAGHGKLYGYYAADSGAKEDYDGVDRENVDEGRYRIGVSHQQNLGSRDYFLLDATYLSDEFLLEDFFDSDYRASFQPQNHATLTHRGEGLTMGLSAYKRLNDFYTTVERLPEGFLDINRMQVGDSDLYYESRNSISFLNKAFSEEDGSEDYSAGRLDTSHKLYYPTRHFGFLNLIPRTGYRATYYSETVEWSTATQTVAVVTTNLTTVTQTNTTRVARDLGSDVRSLFELGLEASFRAFKVLSNEENMFGSGLRHVVEPYANYTFIPEPNLTPENLYEFDSIDRLDENNTIRFGARNRYQTRRDGRVDDIMDLDLFATYDLEAEDDPISEVGLNSEFSFSKSFQVFMDGLYDTVEGDLRSFNSRARYRGDRWNTSIEHRYRNEDSNLLGADLEFAPNKNWAFGLYDRYEFETSQLEEQGVYLTRMLDCMGIRVGGSYLPGYTRDDGTEREDDYRATVQMWLTAFPNIRFGSAPRN